MNEHLSREQAVALALDVVDAQDRGRLLAHAASCAECSRLLAAERDAVRSVGDAVRATAAAARLGRASDWAVVAPRLVRAADRRSRPTARLAAGSLAGVALWLVLTVGITAAAAGLATLPPVRARVREAVQRIQTEIPAHLPSAATALAPAAPRSSPTASATATALPSPAFPDAHDRGRPQPHAVDRGAATRSPAIVVTPTVTGTATTTRIAPTVPAQGTASPTVSGGARRWPLPPVPGMPRMTRTPAPRLTRAPELRLTLTALPRVTRTPGRRATLTPVPPVTATPKWDRPGQGGPSRTPEVRGSPNGERATRTPHRPGWPPSFRPTREPPTREGPMATPVGAPAGATAWMTPPTRTPAPPATPTARRPMRAPG